MPCSYVPKTIDLSGVAVPQELLDLTEKLAEANHDTWAAQRISQGWTYGPARDDATKQTPCLVPYSDLTDVEKEYDRKTSMDTIRLLLAMGYQIVKETE